MNVSSLASALMAAKAARTQTSIAARIVKMNAAAEDSVADLLRAADNRGAVAAKGTGRLLDITA